MTEHSFDEEYWNRVWRGSAGAGMASNPPNPHLVREVSELMPGTALDAGCGAGTEAIWLATRGWRVTGADISTLALEQARANADRVGVDVQWVEADLSTWEPEAALDLVTTHYAHPTIPQLEFYERLASWVKPGGTLLIVGHLHGGDSHGHVHGGDSHGHGHDDQAGHGRDGGPGGPPDAASATAAQITARLAPDAWEVVTAQESSRTLTTPDGREARLNDVVVRAVRRS